MCMLPQYNCFLVQLFDLAGYLGESSFDVEGMRLGLQVPGKGVHIGC